MTERDFIENIIDLYKVAPDLKFNNKNYSITRGAKHNISSQAEDLFAVFVAEALDDENLKFLINYTLSYSSKGQKSSSFKPDLAVLQNGIITHIFDLKMDLGFRRDYQTDTTFQNAEKRFLEFRKNKTVVDNKKKHFKALVSTNIINQIVVITTENGGTKSFQKNLKKEFENYDWTNIYYLTSDFHPNNCKNKPKVNTDEFQRLLEDARKNL